MLTIMRVLASKAGWLLASFVLVVAMLALWNELPAKLRDWRAEASGWRAAAASLEGGSASFEREARSALGRADAEIAVLKRASDVQLGEAQAKIEGRQKEANARILKGRHLVGAVLKRDTDAVLASYKAEYIELPLLERTASFIALRHANIQAMAAHVRKVRELNLSQAEYKARVATFNRELIESNELGRRAASQWRNWICQRKDTIPGCGLVRKVRERADARAKEREALQIEAARLKFSRRKLEAERIGREAVENGEKIVGAAVRSYQAEANRAAKHAGGYAWNRAWDALGRYGVQALFIVLGAVLLPVLHKLFAFHVIAPFAAGARPVRLRGPAPSLVAGRSAVSVAVPIGPDDELLLRSGLQSAAADIVGGDQLVLDCCMPVTCIAAGLVNLQRLRSDRPESVTVTGTAADQRVAAITVPAGGAVMLHPRALIGVVKGRGQRLAITRPWRIGWLISWITAQFRFVVFHGPCTLIVEGCGGVGVEDARGRTVDKRLTLGCDAGLAYGAARSASFLPYLRGQASLFNDRFDGSGRYLYEQRASGDGGGGLWGRGLKGLGDAVLNVLGI